MRRFICMAISIMMVFALLWTGAAQAAENGTLSDKLKWELSDDGVLTVSGSGEMPDYASPQEAPWAAFREKITRVVFSGTITRIGSNAFAECPNLTHVTFVYSIESIGKRAFYNCAALATSDVADAPDNGQNDHPGDGDRLPGDVNGDGEMDGRDVIRLMKYLAEEIDDETGEVFAIEEANANVNGDEEVDELDLLRLMQYLAGMDVQLE